MGVLKNPTTGKTITVPDDFDLEEKPSVEKVETDTKNMLEMVKKGDYSSYQKEFDKRKEGIDEEIIERGNILENVTNEFKKTGILPKIIGTTKGMAIPFTLIESALAQPMLSGARGEMGVSKIASENISQSLSSMTGLPGISTIESILNDKTQTKKLGKDIGEGLTGQKITEFKDVLYQGGFGKGQSAALGLMASISIPLKTFQSIKGMFGKISKMSDKGLELAGDSLLEATEQAPKYTGNIVDELYKPIENISVGKDETLEILSNLPQPLLKKLTEKIGGIKAVGKLASEMTVGKLRKLQQLVGRLGSTSFGKDTKGVAEKLEDIEINKAYSMIKKLRNKVIETKYDKKIAKELIYADDQHTKILRASDKIKKTIIDPTLLEPTEAGKVAGKMVEPSTLAVRKSLNRLRNVSPETRKLIDGSIKELKKFNRFLFWSNAAKHAANAAVYGGAIGGIGGYVAQKMYKGE